MLKPPLLLFNFLNRYNENNIIYKIVKSKQFIINIKFTDFFFYQKLWIYNYLINILVKFDIFEIYLLFSIDLK